MTGTAKADFPPAQGESEVVTTFQSNVEMPESIATDLDGTVYVGLFMPGQIVGLDPETGDTWLHAQFDLGFAMCAPDQAAGLTGMALNVLTGVIYVNVNTCDPSTHGLWKVLPDGTTSMVAIAPMGSLMNGLVKRGWYLYAVDSFSMTGTVYKTPVWNDGDPLGVLIEQDPLIAFDPTIPPPPGISFMPGANGLQKYRGDLYVGHSGKNIIIKIPMSGWFRPTAGTPEWFVDAHGVDDFAFDWQGTVYFTNDPFNQLVKVTPDNVATVLLTEADGLNGSTAAAFGRLCDSHVLYVTSAAFPFMPPPYNNGQAPSVIAFGNDVAGYPFR